MMTMKMAMFKLYSYWGAIYFDTRTYVRSINDKNTFFIDDNYP